MKSTTNRLTIDSAKVRKVQKLLGAKTPSEAVERALDEVVVNAMLDRRHQKMVDSDIAIVEVLAKSAS